MEHPKTDNSQLRDRTVRSVGWSVAAKFFRQFMQLIFQIILARMLTPSDFGLLSMILVFSALADILKNMGLGAAIIQRKEVSAVQLSSVFWMNMFAGCILFIVFQLVAPLIAHFYGVAQLADIVRVYALIYLVGSLNVVQEALLQKKLQFKRLFLVEAVAVFCGGGLALFLAYNGFGVWTLVWQYLAIAVISSLLLWLTSSWRPSLTLVPKSLKELRKFGAHLVGHELLSFVSRNIDNLFVGKFLGARALGIYSRAYFLMLQPINITSQVLARVMFPVFASMQHDQEYILRTYLKSTRLVAYIIFPAIAYVFVMADPLILLLLGKNWTEVALILQIFCVYSLVDTIGLTSTWIYKSMGRTDLLFRWTIYNTVVIITAIVIGLRWGVVGVAVAYTSAFLVLLWLPGWYIAFKLINLRISTMLRNLLPVFISMVLTAFIMEGSRILLYPRMGKGLLCLTVFVIGITSYLIVSKLLDGASFRFFARLIRNTWNKRLSFSPKLNFR